MITGNLGSGRQPFRTVSTLSLIVLLTAVLLVSGCTAPSTTPTGSEVPKTTEEVSEAVTNIGKDIQGISDILSDVDSGLSGNVVKK